VSAERGVKKYVLAAAVSPLALAASVAFAAGASASTTSTAAAAVEVACGQATATVGTSLGDGQSLSAEQLGNARTIYEVGVQLGIPAFGEEIAIATAMQESGLINLTTATNYDSLGLFQQRPSQGWGTPAELTDPTYAAKAFYDALLKVSGWQQVPLTVAAQDVQQSAFPDAYAKWESPADSLVASFGGGADTCPTSDGDGQTTTSPVALPVGFSLPAGTPAQVVTAIEYELAQLGKPYIYGGAGPTGYDCSGLVQEAYLAAGISLPRTTYQQVDSGTPVYSANQLQPGDLIFTAGSDGTDSNPGHVGMFLGGDLVEDAPHTGANIEISKFDGGYWNVSAVAFRRIVKQV
jgi:cell wall-associated NlpC family hydrolase